MSRIRPYAATSGSTRLCIMCILIALGITACGSLTSPSKTTPSLSYSDPSVHVWVTTTDRTKLLSREPDVFFGNTPNLPANIDVDPSVQYQEMVGFGAAITDASAWLIQNKLNEAQRAALLRDLFGGSPGLGLSFTRLTIGASDFSRSHYSFDDMPAGQTDPTLARFSIDANRAEVLPVVKSALALNPSLRVMASPWSAPGWMKTTDSLIKGSLRPDAYEAFSEYLLRYIEAYAKEGVPIYAVTLQNEPHFEPENYPGMRVDPAARARLIGQYIGPRMAQRDLNTRILDWDHNWDEPDSPLAVLADKTAHSYVDGVAWHCYGGEVSAQTKVHDAYPEKDVYFTECSRGGWASPDDDPLTWLTRNLIIGSTRGWAKGVLFWNLALDENHGPHLGGCGNCGGVVTVNSANGEVTRNGEYYALAHASSFVRPGARRIKSNSLAGKLDTVAFQNADDASLVLIAANSTIATQRFSVRSGERSFQYELPAKSVATFSWQP
ncbi:MAG: glycoside hydrolase family 30 protein [Methylotenera sp.]